MCNKKGCGIEFPPWARYPDAKCIDGLLYDMDSRDEDLQGYTSGGDEKCPVCHPEWWLDSCKTEDERKGCLEWIEGLKEKYLKRP